ncbi:MULTISPECIES: GspH/FimT family pseudopilin [unclassified Acidovorax]|uniref:GspH/FimT family pseudopilin n=1 Tax=unclassified Acidovorax TaxID=2684926 RepID=UPI00210505F0|nr:MULTISPECIES: GspH/FimT family pseudopilin [unclassified Acidovorax]
MQQMQTSYRARFLWRNLSTSYSRANRGFTIVELMVVVLIVAILAALALPSFNPIIERWRVQQALKGLESSIYYARAEAIKRASTISIRKNPTGTDGCTLAPGNADWDCGWFVFVDTNSNGVFDAGEEVLQRFTAPRNTQVTRTANSASMQFDRWGRITGPFVGFSLVPHNKNISDLAARGLCVSSGGRIRTIKSEELPCTAG